MKKLILIIVILLITTACTKSLIKEEEKLNVNLIKKNKILKIVDKIKKKQESSSVKKEMVEPNVEEIKDEKEIISPSSKLNVKELEMIKKEISNFGSNSKKIELIKEDKGEYVVINENSIENKQEVLLKTNPVSISLIQKGNNIEILLLNPKKKEIQSVRTWLSFKKDSLIITELNLNNTVFDLAAPSEYLVDKENGIVKIGLSSTKGTNIEQVKIGSFNVKNISQNPVLLSCYDYSDESDSHCTVIEAQTSQNILNEPESILIN